MIEPNLFKFAVGLANPAAPTMTTVVNNVYVTIIGEDDGNIPNENWDPLIQSSLHPNRKGILIIPDAGKFNFLYEPKIFADFVWEKLL